jgi:hypothetical protein
MPTLVLVPGAWHGGWWFEPLARQFVDTNDDGLYHCAACSNLLFDGRATLTRGSSPCCAHETGEQAPLPWQRSMPPRYRRQPATNPGSPRPTSF